ncbi:MAG: serine/threonine-protein kinase [Byssovorax sp.]
MRPEPGKTTVTAETAPGPRLAEASALPKVIEPGLLPRAILDRYEIVALLGRGGMGQVYRARDRVLGRDVALKILLSQSEAGEGRALREARAQARLDHDHACKVFEVGVSDGVCHIAMQLIDGEPFSVACRRMTLEEKVEVVIRIAGAAHEAHRIGLVHRDIKPHNIMIDRGEPGGGSSGKPYLMDFGIAREVGADGVAATLGIVGTPAYMAPEQARGDAVSLDRRTDVYALGATLFEAIAGRPPFEADGAWALIQKVIGEEAPPLRAIAPEAPADLEAVVARCLDKAPHRRYPSARALAEDLRRFLDGDPVEARRLGRAHRLGRAARRHRGKVALALGLIGAAITVVALGVRERRTAEAQAELGRALGEDIKEIELSLRIAFELPLHDVEPDKDALRGRLAAIEAKAAASGARAEGRRSTRSAAATSRCRRRTPRSSISGAPRPRGSPRPSSTTRSASASAGSTSARSSRRGAPTIRPGRRRRSTPRAGASPSRRSATCGPRSAPGSRARPTSRG